ncbi:energy-coupling factor transporter transmembrane protein EcfT [Phaeobacter sp. HF9A]|uniref:energy-coupling factor transporter transmembrane component T family protein n=1 Tax=Phaeobacter sp. HF9A TaxID=2721561 RepID=UPI0014318637|nr:energy-coupling factor transporter transmembrane protein EcfT [Phaeobacter sp. HF9A]NIZ14583.1 energy-coupling factor transporter transmembrane protein EcfT [Phaeobacter sp. HF9A]
MFDLYCDGHSPLHRMKPGWKILALAAAGTALFAVDHVVFSLGLLGLTLVLYRLAQLPLRRAWDQIRPVLWVFGLIFLAQLVFNSWQIGVFVILRFATLLMLAGLLTLTTRSSDMIEGIEAGLHPLRRVLPVARISLAISLTLRFIPVLSQVVQDVREAQKTRGLERNLIALAIPVVIRTIQTSEEIADAIDARGY